MVKATHPPANAFVAFFRKLYNPLGFSKGYNFIFCVLESVPIPICVVRLTVSSFYHHGLRFRFHPFPALIICRFAASSVPTAPSPHRLRLENATTIFETLSRPA